MSRRVRTVVLQSAAGGDAKSSYADKAASYIPGEVVAAWVAVTALIEGAPKAPQVTLSWVMLVVGIVATAIYTYRQTREGGRPVAKWQIIITTFAFAVWVFGLGGPFASLAWYLPVYGQIFLVLWTLLIAPILPIRQT